MTKVSYSTDPKKAYMATFGVKLVPTFEDEETPVELEKMYTCWDCFDTQEQTIYEIDSDTHAYVPSGDYKPCSSCQ